MRTLALLVAAALVAACSPDPAPAGAKLRRPTKEASRGAPDGLASSFDDEESAPDAERDDGGPPASGDGGPARDGGEGSDAGGAGTDGGDAEGDEGDAPDAGSADVEDPGEDDAGPPASSRPPCPPIGVDHDVDVGGFVSDRYAWSDEGCLQRTAALVHNDRVDGAGHKGGYLRELTYQADGAVRRCTGSSTRHPGWGYTTNHFGPGGTQAVLSHWIGGTFTRVLQGRHHAVHQYAWDLPIDGRVVKATVHWLFATGRDAPVWAVTFDASAVPVDAISADTRSPYGDLQWDYGQNADVDGIAWGDRRVFTTTSSPVTPATSWRYDQHNAIPFVRMWSDAADAEMGVVQTQTWQEHDAGGYWLYSRWGTQSSGPMPEDWNWTYQLNQYELPVTTKSKRLAWGSNYGAVGKAAYPAYGDDRMLSGWPYQSYSVHVVLGKKSEGAVQSAIDDVEAMHAVDVACDVGEAATSGAPGVARSDVRPLDVPGYSPVYGTLDLVAAEGRLRCTLSFDGGPVRSPIVRVKGAAAAAQVRVDGQIAVADRDAYVSHDPGGGSLWITLPGERSGVVSLEVGP